MLCLWYESTNDIPAVEHKKWSRDCIYLKLTCYMETYKVQSVVHFRVCLTTYEWKEN